MLAEPRAGDGEEGPVAAVRRWLDHQTGPPARYLGPDDMGRQSFIAFVSLALVLAATAGLPHSLTRFIGELLGAGAGGHAMSLYRMTRRVEGAAAALVLAALAVVAALGGDPAAAWVLAGLSGALHVLQTVPQSLLAGAQRWRDC